ncbi:fibronectin type III domain-containing protein [Saccharothrix sp. Mg75]|uniref:fibronectin type III domain-containing protein n=1 Tax=Saccharothrix sp. Mg75 TaxID=3445357 RepID=UPI003EEBF135
MRRRRQARRLTGLGAVATAAAVVAGLVTGTGTGSAAPGELTQTYACPLPLIGPQDVTVEIAVANQPASIAAGTFTPALDITAVSNAGATSTQALRLVGAETIRGFARATSEVTSPGGQGTQAVRVTTDVPEQPIPAVGNDLVLDAVGSAPGLRFDEPGTATVEVTDLVLEMTPLRADGTPTELGTFVADCTPAAGQDTVLQAYEVTGAAVAPETPAGVGSTPPLRQTYTCPFPLIGNQAVTVDIDTDALPAEIPVGAFTPPIGITAVSNAGPTSTQGLRLVGAETIQGTAVAASLVDAPQGHLAVAVATGVPNQPIPLSGDLIVDAAGSAPALRFDQPGTATVSVHDLVLTLTPLRADGTPTGLGTFVADCTPTAGQRTVLHTFTVTPAADTEVPSAPSGLTAGDTTQTSVPLSWTAATDNIGVTAYELFNNSTLVTTVTGTSTTVDGLAADTEYTFTVVALDAAGNRSTPSAPVTARTKAVPDTQAPTTPANLTATAVTQTGATLSWSAASDNTGVTAYELFNNSTLVTTVTDTTATVTGLSADTEYTFAVVAVDAAGNRSAASAPAVVRTPAAPDTESPSTPANLRSTGASASSIGLAWDASSDNIGVSTYELFNNSTLITTTASTAATAEGLAPDAEYTFTVVALDAAGNRSAAGAPVTARTETAPDTEGPSTPTGLTASGATQSSVTLAWVASTDDVGVTGYDVYRGTVFAKSVEGTSAVVDGLAAGTEYTFTVVAKDAAGNRSAAGAEVTARTADAPDTQAPSTPSALRSTAQTQTTVDLAWDASSDNVAVSTYELFNNSTLMATVPGTTATIEGLTADTGYSFSVVAVDAAGNRSGASAAVVVRTKPDAGPPVVRYGYGLSGTTGIKAAGGSVALKGGIDAALDLSTGAFDADLRLDPTTGRFTLFRFVPVKVKIEFVQAARTTGTLTGGVLRSTSTATVTLPHVSVLGIPVSTGRNCGTTTPASIPLESGPGFDPLAGGTLTGTYTLPPLKGCGPLTPLISALTSGPGNTIEVELAPR